MNTLFRTLGWQRVGFQHHRPRNAFLSVSSPLAVLRGGGVGNFAKIFGPPQAGKIWLIYLANIF